METLNFSVLCANCNFHHKSNLSSKTHEKFCITLLLKSPHSNASSKIWLFPEPLPVGIEAYIYLHVKKKNKPDLVRRFLSIRIWRRTVSSWVFYTIHAKASSSYLKLKSNNISNLDNSLTRWKRPIFKYRQAIAKILLFYILGTRGILHTQFGSIWTSLWPDEKDLFLKFANRKIRKFPYEKLTFFLHKLYQKFFLF